MKYSYYQENQKMADKICGTYEVNIAFFIAIFGIPGILILVLSFPYITFKEIIASSILLGIMALGILYMHYKS